MNWTTILVPLDGSDVAAAALPYARVMARAAGAAVRLLAVVEREPRGFTKRSERVAADIEGLRQSHLERALADAAATLRAHDIAVRTTVMVGEPVAAILAAAQEGEPALIVMATHGRGGIDRAAMGSVADKVLRLAHHPVLIVRPPYYPVPQIAPHLARLAVPLDGSVLAEAALGPATELAGATGAELILVRVEPWRTEGTAPLGSNPELMRMEEEIAAAAQDYVEAVRQRLPAELSVRTLVLRGRPAETLLDVTRHERIDLLVMTTHGRGGLRRLVLGSVADRVIRTNGPVLLIRPLATHTRGSTTGWVVSSETGTLLSKKAARTVRAIMSTPVITITEQATLDQAARVMLDRGIGALPVVNTDGVLCGIVTESDFTGKERPLPFSVYRMPQLFGRWVSKDEIEAIYAAARTMTVREIMTTPVITATEDEPIGDVVQRMLRHDLTRIPVVRDRVPVGMIARRDLLKLMTSDTPQEQAEAPAEA